MNIAPSQQIGERGHVRVPFTSMQSIDVQKQNRVLGPTNVAAMNSPLQWQPNTPHTQLHQNQHQAWHRSMSVSPAQHAGLHRSTSVSPVPHTGQFVASQQPGRRVSSPQQAYIAPKSQDRGLPSPSHPTSALQDGRRPSPTKRASFDPQLEHVTPAFLQENQRYPSPTKRKTMAANPTSFDVTTRPQMAPAQQEVASPRKSMIQQGKLLSPRKSTMMMPQSQLSSPRKSIQQQEQPFSPRKSVLLQQGLDANSLSTYPEHSVLSSQQENTPVTASYINHKSMSMSPAVHEPSFDDYDDDGYDDDNSHPRSVNRSTSMSPVAPSVRFQENEEEILPSTSNNHVINQSMDFPPVAHSMAKQQQMNLPIKIQPNMNARISLSPRQIQTQHHSQQPSSPARLQSSMNRSLSMSPTQMNAEQQPQLRLSSVNLAAVQGVRPGSPPQLNRYLSTAAPRVSVVTPSRASNTFQPNQLLSTPSSKQMQVGRMSVNQECASSNRGLINHERHLSVTDVVLRSMAAIASAVAFCVMITNTVWINGQTFSFSNIAGFRYVAGISATAFIISILQLGVIVSQKLRSHTLGIEIKPTMPRLFSSMIVDQLLAYLLLSAGSVGVGGLVYIPSICKSDTEISAEFCSRSTLSVVLTLVAGTIFVMSALLATFKFYQKVTRPP